MKRLIRVAALVILAALLWSLSDVPRAVLYQSLATIALGAVGAIGLLHLLGIL